MVLLQEWEQFLDKDQTGVIAGLLVSCLKSSLLLNMHTVCLRQKCLLYWKHCSNGRINSLGIRSKLFRIIRLLNFSRTSANCPVITHVGWNIYHILTMTFSSSQVK